jgi:hypothetical protein
MVMKLEARSFSQRRKDAKQGSSEKSQNSA